MDQVPETPIRHDMQPLANNDKPRSCFRDPVPELDVAAERLSAAADALLAGDESGAATLLRQAHVPALYDFVQSVAGQGWREHVHFREATGIPGIIEKPARVPLRMPQGGAALAVYERDGYRCRYCGIRIVIPGAFSVLRRRLPNVLTWGTRDTEMNTAMYALKGVLDHVLPHARGGTSDAGNLVTSCQTCNYGKGDFHLAEVGLDDPRTRPPQRDGWDGLRRLLSAARPASRGPAHPRRGASLVQNGPAKPPSNPAADWFAALNAEDSARLRELLADLAELGVTWSATETLVVTLRHGGATLDLLGVNRDLTVEVPWMVHDHKAELRLFAAALAAGIPGTEVYETRRWWRVRMSGRRLALADLLGARPSVHEAFCAMRHALGA